METISLTQINLVGGEKTPEQPADISINALSGYVTGQDINTISSCIYNITNNVNNLNIVISDFITSSVTELDNFYTKTQVNLLPISTFDNDVGYITSSVTELNNFYTKAQVNTLPISIFYNDKGYVTNADIDLHNYYTSDQVNELPISTFDNDVGYVTEYAESGQFLLSSTFEETSGSFALTSELTSKIEFSINNELPTNNLSSNVLYLTPDGEVAAVINNQLTNLSVPIASDLNEYSEDDDNILPTCKAVSEYVDANYSTKVNHINCEEVTLSSNVYYECLGEVSSIILDISDELENACCTFTTSSTITYNISMQNVKINEPINFLPSSTYIIMVDKNTFLWTELFDTASPYVYPEVEEPEETEESAEPEENE